MGQGSLRDKTGWVACQSILAHVLAGLLRVSNKVPYLHTSRVSMEVQVHKRQKRGLSD